MTTPAAGDDASTSGPSDQAPPPPADDPTFDPFRFGRPDPDSPAAAAYPHLFPPRPAPEFPAGPFPGTLPPPNPSSGYGYAPPGQHSADYPNPGYPPTAHEPSGFRSSGYPVPGYGYPPTPAASNVGNGRAVAGLILGICSVVLCFATLFDLPIVILGVIYSSLGLQATKEGKGQRGLAVAGLALSILGAVFVVAVTVFLLHQINHCQVHHDQGTRAYNECIVHF